MVRSSFFGILWINSGLFHCLILISRRHHEEPLSQGAAKMRTEILYEDNSILVIRKPAGLAVQSARIGQADVVSELKSYLAKQAGVGNL